MSERSAIQLEPASSAKRGETPVSVVIITRDEESNIGACLDSVSWAAERIVVDSGSVDRTVAIARDQGAKILEIEWRGFGDAKQRGLEAAREDWVLSLDADERVTPELRAEIHERLKQPTMNGFEIPRLTSFIGAWIRHSGWYPDYVLRLVRRERARFTDSLVHEKLEVDGQRARLRNHLLHYSYTSIEDYLKRLNRYTTLAAQELHDSGKRFAVWQPLLKAPAVFVKRFLLKRGFLDGWAGLQIAVLSAVYVFVKYAKLGALQRREGNSEAS